VEIVEASPMATQDEMRHEFTRRTGLKVHRQTLVAALRREGIEHKLGREVSQIVTKPPAPARYGYTAAHRRHEPERAA